MHYHATATWTPLFARAPQPPGPFPAHLDEDPHVLQVSSVPLVEGLQELQTVAGGAHVHLNSKDKTFV